MKFCPHCHTRLPAGIQKCPHCDREIPVYTPKMVAIHSLPGKLYAEMVKEVLEKRGIPCVIKTDLLSAAFGSGGISAVGAQATIFVPEDRREESEEILHQMLDHI